MHQTTSIYLSQLTPEQAATVREWNELAILCVAALLPCEITSLVFMFVSLTSHLPRFPLHTTPGELQPCPAPIAHLLLAHVGCSIPAGARLSNQPTDMLLLLLLLNSILKCTSYHTPSILHLTFCTEAPTSLCWCLRWQGLWAIQC